MSRKFQSHAYPVNRTEAIEIGLPVNKTQDKALEKLMWNVWLNVEKDLKEHEPFDPLFELSKSQEAQKIFGGVPQMNLPMPASSSAHFQTTMAEVQAAVVSTIDPVGFECNNAVIESSKMAHAFMTKGKILACRTPDLMVHFNMVTTSRGWEKTN